MAAIAPGIEEVIHGGMLLTEAEEEADVTHLNQSISRISHAVKKRKSSRAWCKMRAATLF